MMREIANLHETPMSDQPPAAPVIRPSTWSEMRRTEDWWAIWIGGLLLLLILGSILWRSSATEAVVSSLKPYIAKPAKWRASPLEALVDKKGHSLLPGIAGVGLLAAVMFSLAQIGMRRPLGRFLRAFPAVFGLALLSQLLSEHEIIKYYNLEYPLWGLLIGLIFNVTVGAEWLRPALQTEFYIKTGLVLLGVEVLLPLLLSLGIPGICVSWVVTPIVLITTYLFGQKVLRMESPSLNMVISADMAVCGVSAAIATGAACRARKEEISLAITLSLVFTAIMMVLQPLFISLVGMNEVVAGAWLGGTIDSTGAVGAAGELVGPAALKTATTVKLIQNILIGVIAFGVATFWVTHVERQAGHSRPDPWEIWYRFPKFVIGFVAVSAIFSWISATGSDGLNLVKATESISKELRTWFFCLAFVCIGLDVNFQEVRSNLKGGKPLILYVCGQTLNLVLTFVMAWLMFGVLFESTSRELIQQSQKKDIPGVKP